MMRVKKYDGLNCFLFTNTSLNLSLTAQNGAKLRPPILKVRRGHVRQSALARIAGKTKIDLSNSLLSQRPLCPAAVAVA